VTGATGVPLEIVRAAARRRHAPLHASDDGGRLFDAPPSTSASSSAPTTATDEAAGRLAFATLRSLGLGSDAERRALAAAAAPPSLPARRERFDLGQGRTVLLDGAHNPAAASALAADAPAGAHVLLGVAGRKDARRIRSAFVDAPRLTLTAVTPGERPWNDDPAFVADAGDALESALAALPIGGTLIVTGSFHLAGRLRPAIRLRSAATGDARDPRYAPSS